MVPVLNFCAHAPCLSWYSPKYISLFYSNPPSRQAGNFLQLRTSLWAPWLNWIVYILVEFFLLNFLKFSLPTFGAFSVVFSLHILMFSLILKMFNIGQEKLVLYCIFGRLSPGLYAIKENSSIWTIARLPFSTKQI